jgi:mono/diheme cytochrome c family protein
MRPISIAKLAAASLCLFSSAANAETPVERGLYLVTISGCNDCHTPGGMLGNRDKTRLLGGSDVGFGDPGSGVWIGGNLTPDQETGLGKWTTDQILAAFTKGKRPDGRDISEIMPWRALSHLTHEDALAIVAYLQSLPPVKNAVPGPYKAGETPAVSAVSVIVPVPVYSALPKPADAK